jgi:pyridoxamine 5'-phosphate oxidase
MWIDLVTDTALSVAERHGDTLAQVDAADLDHDPLAQLEAWLAEARAAGIVNAEAMALATASRDGAPSVRMVLLRGHDRRRIAFFTNLESRKAKELAANPRAAGALYWQPLDRQVRLEGAVQALPQEHAEAYFGTRPRDSRIAAWASPQSRLIVDRAELERLYAEAQERFAGVDEPPLPPHWGGYLLDPQVFEFWQSRPNRLHDRIRYERDGDGWRRFRLAP